MIRYLSISLLSIFPLALGCGAADEAEPLAAPVASGGSAGTDSSNPLGRMRCRAPEGVSASPQNVEQTMQLLNALPKPTSVACFVESLARPLAVNATNSTFSAQPALSSRSPRILIKLGELWVSVAIDGDGIHLLEFGEIVPGDVTRSIKGELELPLYNQVTASAPFERIKAGDGTLCGLCHYDERPVDDRAGAYSSIAFRPREDTRVSIDSLLAEQQSCDWQTQPRRCEMLSALFEGGSVEEIQFPSEVLTFF